MSRKLILLALVLGLTSTSYGLVIGNWEGTSLDGWSTSSTEGMDGGATTAFSTNGVTLDDQSLAVTTATGWKKTICGVLDRAGINALQTKGSKFIVDLTLLKADWDFGSGAKIDSIIFQSSYSGWQQVAGVMSDWDGNDLTVHMEAAVPLDLQQAGYLDWAKVTFATWINTATEGYTGKVGALYFDDAELIPEPATIAMLGLGGLALIRRKR